MRFARWRYTIPLRLRSLFRRDRVERELADEFHYHIEQQIEAGLAKDLTPEEARRAALHAIGGLDQRKEECRDARRTRWITDTAQDVRFALRVLAKDRWFTSVSLGHARAVYRRQRGHVLHRVFRSPHTAARA